MDTYSLSIDATRGRLDMEGQNLRLSTSMPLAQMDISKERGGLQVQTQHPQVTVDAAQALSQENRATLDSLIAQNAQEGKQAVQEAMVRYNQQGQVYRALPRNKNAIRQNVLNQAIPGLQAPQITFIPSERPHINVTDNVIDMRYTPDVLHIDFETHQQADISVNQLNQLSIWVADEPSMHFSISV